jgi:hypothetical protein
MSHTIVFRVEYEYLSGPIHTPTPVWLSQNGTFDTHDEAIERLNLIIRKYNKPHEWHLTSHYHYYTGRFQIVRVETRIDYTPVTQIDTNEVES